MARDTRAERKGQIGEVYLIRSFAMFGVLAVHATATAVTQLSPESALYPAYILVNRLGKVGTTTFIFLSSLVLFYNYYGRTLNAQLLKRFYTRRTLFVLVPYILWSAFYYCVGLVLLHGWSGSVQAASVGAFVKTLVYGNAHFHLYFVVISVQLYLVFPLMLWLVKRVRPIRRYLVLWGLLAQWAFYLYARHVGGVEFKSSMALSYFSHYCLGAFAGLYYERFVAFLEQRRVRFAGRSFAWGHVVGLVWAAAGLAYCTLYYRAFGFAIWYDGFWYELVWSIYTYTSILMLVCLARAVYRNGSAKLVAAAARIGAVAFGVYLIHPLPLLLWERYVTASSAWLYHVGVVAGFATVSLASWLVVTAVHRWLPVSWPVFGPKPQISTQPPASR